MMMHPANSRMILLLCIVGFASAATIPRPRPNATNTTTPETPGYIVLLQQGRLFNDTVSVPVWERLDNGVGTGPAPAMIAAEDFTVPLAVQSCRSLVADLVLFRQLGRESNYVVPHNITLWLFAHNEVSTPVHFNASRALVERVFTVPTEGQWDPVGSTGGTTVDRGAGYYYHIERLRFELTNLTLRSNTTYWLACLVSLNRNYSPVDYSMNLVRWATSEVETVSIMGTAVVESYRVVDWHGNMFRDVPALINWTSAEQAEATILPYFTSIDVRQSRHKQLALDVYGHNCVNVTRLPTSVALLTALPARDWNPPPPPAAIPSPLPAVVVEETPSSSPTSPPPPQPPTSTWVAPEPVQSVVPAVSLPSPFTWSSSSSSSSSTTESTPSVTITTQAPSKLPTVLPPPPAPLPSVSSTSSGGSGTPSSPPPLSVPSSASSPANGTNEQQQQQHEEAERIAVRDWIFVGLGAIFAIVLVVILFIVIVRWRHRVRYESVPMRQVLEENSSVEEETEDQKKNPGQNNPEDDAHNILLDDNDDNNADTKKEKKKKAQDSNSSNSK